SVKKAVANNAAKTLVVLNHNFPEMKNEVADLPVSIVWNYSSTLGMSSSLVIAIKSLPPSCDAALILLSDQPEVKVEIM
ncbi:NTP transferase domain-containing protein, partial [Alkalihalophilus pseudofirmus]